MTQVKQNNQVIDPKDAQSTSVYRLKLGVLKFYSSRGTLITQTERSFQVPTSARMTPLTIQTDGYPKISFNNAVFTTADLANNTLRGIQHGDIVEIISQTSPQTTYRYYVRLRDTGQIADNRDGGRSIRVFLDKGSQAVVDASNPMPLTGITDGTEFEINIRRWDAPLDNKVQVWTRADGYIDPSLINKEGLGIDETFTTAEKNKLDNIEAQSEVNVQSDFTQTDSTADDFMENKPLDDGRNFYYVAVPYGTTFQNSSATAWTQIQGSGIAMARGAYFIGDARKTPLTNPTQEQIDAMNEPDVREGITETIPVISTDFTAEGFNGYQPTAGEDEDAPDYRALNPRFMMYLLLGDYGDLIPISTFQYVSLTPAEDGDTGWIYAIWNGR